MKEHLSEFTLNPATANHTIEDMIDVKYLPYIDQYLEELLETRKSV